MPLDISGSKYTVKNVRVLHLSTGDSWHETHVASLAVGKFLVSFINDPQVKKERKYLAFTQCLINVHWDESTKLFEIKLFLKSRALSVAYTPGKTSK